MTKRERMKMRRNAATRDAAKTAGSKIVAIESKCAYSGFERIFNTIESFN